MSVFNPIGKEQIVHISKNVQGLGKRKGLLNDAEYGNNEKSIA